ncbi:MAG: hypothetical protein K2X77_01165 [Candidatus Obscuribacterales bacterium]|nr:hypothetical protein [Candidatus Obscuribacterales bacterium]
MDGLSLWLEKRLRPLSKSFANVSPELFSWMALAASVGAGFMLFAAEKEPLMALAVLPLMVIRLVTESIEQSILVGMKDVNPGLLLTVRLCHRLSDLSMLLGLIFWEQVRPHLALLAIISMLLVSYVGEIGNGFGSSERGGLLCKSNRIVLLMFFCVVYAFRSKAEVYGYSVFEVMFVLFIPLASITLLQRMDAIINSFKKKD